MTPLSPGTARVGVAGIGMMGWPISSTLVSAGFEVTVLDVDATRAADFASERAGVRVAADAADLAREVDAVVTILPTSDHVRQVIEDAETALSTGTLVIEMSSGDPFMTRTLADRLSRSAVGLIDCPVSGGVKRAQSGSLSIMAGGSREDLDRAMPILQSIGSEVHYCGPVGAGHATKALNNLVSATGLLCTMEALAVGVKFGLDPTVMTDVFNASTAMSNTTKSKVKQFVLSRRFDSGFGLDLMVKDLSIALGLADRTGTSAPVSALSQQLWRGAAATLGVGRDHTAVAKFVEEYSGTTLQFGGTYVTRRPDGSSDCP